MSELKIKPLNSRTHKLKNRECAEILGGSVAAGIAIAVQTIQAAQGIRDSNTASNLQTLGVLASVPNPNQPVKDAVNFKIAQHIAN